MPAALILNQSQAEAVYSAMCALNNVSGRIDAQVPAGGGTSARVRENTHGSILVAGEFRGEAHGGPWEEIYASQEAFAIAYGLNSDAAPDVRGEIVNPLDNTHLRHARVNSAAGRAIAERFHL